MFFFCYILSLVFFRTDFLGKVFPSQTVEFKVICRLLHYEARHVHQTLLVRLNQGGCDGVGMWHAFERREILTLLWWANTG